MDDLLLGGFNYVNVLCPLLLTKKAHSHFLHNCTIRNGTFISHSMQSLINTSRHTVTVKIVKSKYAVGIGLIKCMSLDQTMTREKKCPTST